MKILIIGTGYVGLVTGTCFAEMGHTVTCLDIDEQKISGLNRGEIHIYEPGLKDLVAKNVASGRLFFTTAFEPAIKNSEIAFIAVSTPPSQDGSCDTSFIFQVVDELAKHMHGYYLVVNKSTAAVGTVDKIRSELTKKVSPGVEFDVVSNPEFLKEGCAVNDCLKPDRIIIGADSPRGLKIMREIYSPFTLNHDRILSMDSKSAEMTKYAANYMLASRISIMNELAGLCEHVGANINNVRTGIGSDDRIGYHFLYAGVGFGGSCFPKDIKALESMSSAANYEMPILKAVQKVNERQKISFAKKIITHFKKDQGIKGKNIAIWGLAFKPDTDDMREAPSIQLIKELLDAGANLRLYDPVSMQNAKKIFKNHPQITWANDEYDAAAGSDCIALVTEWKQFRFADFEKILKTSKTPVFFDGRNQYKPHEMKKKGFEYFGIGIPSA